MIKRNPEFIWNAWHVAALSHEIDADILFTRRLLDVPVLIYRKQSTGEAVALHDRCPHRFAYLSKGVRKGDQIECIYHGLRFGTEGQCTHSPYQETPPTNATVQPFPLVEKHKMLWIWMGDAELADPTTIPDHSHMDRDDLRPLLWHYHFNGNWQLGNDNLMELTHLFFLHTSTIGGWKDEPGKVPGEQYTVRKDDSGRVISRTFVPNVAEHGTFDNGVPRGTPFDQWNDTIWHAPANMRFTMGAVPTGQPTESCAQPYMEQSHCITPETATTSHYFSGFTRTFELDRDAAGDQQFIDFFSGIFAREDGPIMEDIETQMDGHDLLAQNPVVLPRDKGAIMVRRIVAQRLAAESALQAEAAE